VQLARSLARLGLVDAHAIPGYDDVQRLAGAPVPHPQLDACVAAGRVAVGEETDGSQSVPIAKNCTSCSSMRYLLPLMTWLTPPAGWGRSDRGC
jgi:hypothetical protein